MEKKQGTNTIAPIIECPGSIYMLMAIPRLACSHSNVAYYSSYAYPSIFT